MLAMIYPPSDVPTTRAELSWPPNDPYALLHSIAGAYSGTDAYTPYEVRVNKVARRNMRIRVSFSRVVHPSSLGIAP